MASSLCSLCTCPTANRGNYSLWLYREVEVGMATMKIPKQTKLWITKDERKIRICDMDVMHLCNTIRLLERATKAYYRQKSKELMFLLCTIRGEMALDHLMGVVEEFDRCTWHDLLPNIYYKMVDDAKRQGVTIKQIREKRELETEYGPVPINGLAQAVKEVTNAI